ncbi:nitrite reductase small subunit NirD [Pseudonocardia sp. HH130630-07]|uniref:nitrite reductase small subunit NirD n=1 Tax=Pseudonocardia sp. HH130630-07 TaxID=1690815 RepID=UPI0008152D88|nr:nitrite reductase small subunit NirD [Pseudonocardia sp. HH130630-07]ANY05923.1 nitrite reductase small subunit [Pseudonocardia sp. HH130630-07]
MTAPVPAPVAGGASAWLTVCPLERLWIDRGAAALVGDTQVALFRRAGDAVYALGNIDPFTGAAVMSRGLLGDRAGEPTVATPVHKQVFALRDGRCLDDDGVSLPAFAVRVVGGSVQVGLR